MPLTSKSRVLVVGVGSIGRRHARLLSERDNLQVEICEPNAKSLDVAREEVSDLQNHDDLESGLRTQPDVVVVASPHRLHKDQTLAALESGAHVLCEKPMSDSLLNAVAMKEAADASDRLLSIGFSFHFNPGVRRLRQLMADGELGSILHVHSRVGSYITLVNSISRHQADLAGALLLDYAHQPDLFYWLLGERPKGVYMQAIQGGTIELTSNPNVIDLVCDYEAQVMTSVHLNYLQMPDRGEIEVVGDQGWAHFDMVSESLRIGNRDSRSVETENYRGQRDDIYRAEHQAFFDAISGKRDPESPPSEAIVSMQVIDAAMRSWREQRRVELSPSN